MNTELDPQNDDRLSAYLDNELPKDERAQFEEVLADRADYREVLQRLQRLRADFGSLPRQEAPSDLTRRITAQLRDVTPDSQPTTVAGHWATPTRVLGGLAALAACLALITTLTRFGKQGIELAKAPGAGELAGERVGQLAKEERAPVPPHEQFSLPEGAQAASARPARMEPGPSSDIAGRPSIRSAVAREEPAAANEMPGRRNDARAESFDSDLDGAGLAETISAPDALIDTNTPMAEDAELAEADTGEEDEASIPEVVITAQTQDAFDQLLLVMSQAPLEETQNRDDRLRQQGYYDAQAWVANRNQRSAAKLTPTALTQVIEVTTTPDNIAQLIEVAIEQGADVYNTPRAQQMQSEKIERRSRKRQSNFSGSINNWQQVETAQRGQGRRAASSVEVSEELDNMQLNQLQSDAGDEGDDESVGDQIMRWRITIQPPETEVQRD